MAGRMRWWRRLGLAALVVADAGASWAQKQEEGSVFVFESRTLYPGAEWMADVGLEPTGDLSGDSRGDLRSFAFPPEGRAEACAAVCAADSVCAGWRYEPPEVSGAGAAACFAFEYRAELDYAYHDPVEGWASGLKPDAVRLVRAWPEEEAEEIRDEAATTPLRLAPPPGHEDRPVIWSAEPLEKQAFEAMAMPYPALGDFETALEPGLWRVWGEGAGFSLAGEIRVGADAGARFVIPLDPTPFDLSTPVFFCDGPEICAFEDALTGLAFSLPPGWSAGPAWFYETAGGARASLPTVEFHASAEGGEPLASLNLRQAGQGGRCLDLEAGRLCLHDLSAPGGAAGFELLAATVKPGAPWLGPQE
ncbi:PAN domain-containing protein [Neomegalonema sp.]|uniref:PAN domain-containing protein n=1 Tax=Neomegalonema sp. TaxID=2039713 RepID=UPI0026320623|nr:PAN domain-containing protein [Neomegalonema sp.]MDD2867330.1 PAN domain-containing protein [Neomegalonema sp.]